MFAEDETYEERMRVLLEDTEYDTELGLEMSRDAQRLVAGDITEAEFYEKYHDAVVEEFGEDERGIDEVFEDAGIEDEDASLEEKLKSLAEESDLNRRDAMKGGAAAMAASVGLASASGGESGGPGESNAAQAGGDEGVQWGMVINLNNCDGCLECVVACKGLHGTSEAAHWIYVMAYQEAHQDENNFLVRPCMHCDEAPCEKVCPVGARHTRKKDGLVLSNYEICIGCRYCMVSCPYGANYFQWGEPDRDLDSMDDNFTHDDRGLWIDGPPPKGVMGKCTFEPAWQDGQMGESMVGSTMCEQACTRDAIHFGDLNDPHSDPNTHLEQYKNQQGNDTSNFEDRKSHTVSTFRLLEDKGTDPNVIYIGNEPSPHAEQVEGPVTYEEKGLTSSKRDILAQGAAANDKGGEN